LLLKFPLKFLLLNLRWSSSSTWPYMYQIVWLSCLCPLFSCSEWHRKLFGFLIFSLERTWCFWFTWSVHDVFVSLGVYKMFLFHLEVDEEDHLRFNNRNFNGNFNNKYIYNQSCRCRNTDHWTTLGTNSQSVAYCLTSSEQYFSYIQDQNKLNNV
jgi:hypothetical protein